MPLRPVFRLVATGLVFGITLYGLAVISVLLGLYILAVYKDKRHTSRLTLFCGAVLASVFLPIS